MTTVALYLRVSTASQSRFLFLMWFLPSVILVWQRPARVRKEQC